MEKIITKEIVEGVRQSIITHPDLEKEYSFFEQSEKLGKKDKPFLSFFICGHDTKTIEVYMSCSSNEYYCNLNYKALLDVCGIKNVEDGEYAFAKLNKTQTIDKVVNKLTKHFQGKDSLVYIQISMDDVD